jgi:hypothetical protein
MNTEEFNKKLNEKFKNTKLNKIVKNFIFDYFTYYKREDADLDHLIKVAYDKYKSLVEEFANVKAEVTLQIFKDIMKKNESFPTEFNDTTGKPCLFPESLQEDFTQLPIQADDNCLFNCLTHLPYWKDKHHMYIRHEICNKLDEVIDILAMATTCKNDAGLTLINCFASALEGGFNDIYDTNYERNKQTYIKQMRLWGTATSLGSLLEILTAQIITKTNICVYITISGKTEHTVYEKIKSTIIKCVPALQLNNEPCNFILHLCKFEPHPDIPDNPEPKHYEILTRKYDVEPPVKKEAAKKKVDAEAAEKQAEAEAAKKQAEADAAKKKAEAEAAKKTAEEEAADTKKAEEEAAAKKKAEEEAARVIGIINRAWLQCQTGGSEQFKYKYLKYKIKYLKLKNNTNF